MGIDKDKVFEIIRSVRPLFSDNKKDAEIREKGLADYVTSVDVTVQGILQEKFGSITFLMGFDPRSHKCLCRTPSLPEPRRNA